MGEQELSWSPSQQELARGIALRGGQYRCLLYGVALPQGEAFPRGGRFYDAETMTALHLRKVHGSVLEYLLHRSPDLPGLSEARLELLRTFTEGCTDKEIVAQRRVSPPTVRSHHLKLREKERQARLFSALMGLLRTSRISSPVDIGFCHPHSTASMVDVHYVVTGEERQAILAACFDEAGVLRQWPACEKRKLVILSATAEQSTPGRQYTKEEVNWLPGRIYEDFPYLRRLLTEYGFLERTASGSVHWRKEQAVGRAVGGRATVFLPAGRTVSRFDSSFYLAASSPYALERTGNLGASGLLFILTSLPPLPVAPPLGSLVERAHRKGLLILCDFGVSALRAFLLLFPGPPLPSLFVGTMPFHLLPHLFEIASKVLFPEPCSPERLSSLNGIKSLLDHGAAVLAPAAGAFLFGLCGFRVILLLCALIYGLSALQECFIPYAPCPTQQAELPRLWAGTRYLLGRRELFSPFLLAMAPNFFVANSGEIIFPGTLVELHQFPESRYGLVVSASIAETLLASLFLIWAAHLRPLEHLHALFLVNSALMAAFGLAVPLLCSAPKLCSVLFFTFQLLIGWLTTCINVSLISYFRTRVPLEQQGRFFVLLASFSEILIPLGISYTGVLADQLGPGAAYACNNLCVIVLVLLVRLPA